MQEMRELREDLTGKMETLGSILGNIYEGFQRDQREMPKKIADAVLDVLDQRNIGSDTVTYRGVQSAIQSSLQSSGFIETLEQMRIFMTNLPQAPNPQTQDESIHQPDNQIPQQGNPLDLLRSNGGIHIPESSVKELFVQWYLGNKSKHWPPLKNLTGKDCGDQRKQKRFSEARCLMRFYESKAEEMGIEIKPRTVEEALKIYSHVSPHLQLDRNTPKDRVRRHEELAWRTVLKELRKMKKRA